MSKLDFENNSEHKRLANKIMEGEIILFTGAGFSIGAKNRSTGELLVDTNGLKKFLSNQILKEEPDLNDKLELICEDCKEENKSQYYYYIRKVFEVGSVENYHKAYAKFDWKSIYTVNVDNVLDIIFSDSEDYIYMYKNSPIYNTNKKKLIIKLHGDAIRCPEETVFTEKEYIVSAVSNDERARNLISELRTDNFLFIGASLVDEIDIFVQSANQGVFKFENRMYYIDKKIDDKKIKRLKRKFSNIVIIESTTEDFIEALIKYSEKIKKNKKEIMSYEKYGLNKITLKKYEEKDYLQVGIYKGSEISWKDIATNHDIIWRSSFELLRKLENSKKNISIIHGKAITGKTVMLCRFAMNMSMKANVYEFIGDNFVEALSNFVAEKKNYVDNGLKTIIVVDDASLLMIELPKIIEILKDDQTIRLVISVRQREYYIKQHILNSLVREHVDDIDLRVKKINIDDVSMYLDKLSEKSFLGEYHLDYNRAKKDLVNKIVLDNKGRDEIITLFYKARYEEAEKRIDKIKHSIFEVSNYNVKRFAIYLYILDAIGDSRASLSVFLNMYPINDKDNLKKFLSDIDDILMTNLCEVYCKQMDFKRIIVHARNINILSKIVHSIQKEELLDIYSDLLLNISRISSLYQKRQANNINHMIYTMIRSQNVTKIFYGNNRWNYIKKFYGAIREEFSENHLFWVHWAISEMKCGEYDNAETHLQSAERVRYKTTMEIEHSYAMLNFYRACNKKISLKQRADYYNKATSILQNQINNRQNDAFSIHSFVVKTIDYYESIGKIIPLGKINELISCYSSIKGKYNLSESTIRRNMLNAIHNYIVSKNIDTEGRWKLDAEELTYLKKRNVKVSDESILDMI